MNNRGVIVGAYFDSSSIEHGFIRARDGSLTSFEVPQAAGGTHPEGINDEGDVVGWYFDTNSVRHGFLRDRKGTITPIDVPYAGSQLTSTFAINNKGTIIGWYRDANGNARAFLRSPDGKLIGIHPSGEVFDTVSASINDRGVIDGLFTDSNQTVHGFIRHVDGSIINFDAPGAGTGFEQGTYAAAIFTVFSHRGLNDRGDITGAAVDSSNTAHGFLRKRDGDFVSFDVPGSATGNLNGTWPGSINSSGAICGTYGDVNNILLHGFVRHRNGSVVPFDAPGAVATFVVVINNAGAIAGSWQDANSNTHGFVMTPLREDGDDHDDDSER
jgi:probable HAF family extracellular repeat protein